MTLPPWLRDKRVLIPGAVTFVVLLALGFFMLLTILFSGEKENSKTNSNDSSSQNSDDNGRGGVGLGGDVSKLIGSVSSTRNLKGLTLRINQIDVCQLPDLTAYVAVTTDSGSVSKLTNADIKVTIDGKTIEDPKFEQINPATQPLSATMVIDSSGSMTGTPIEQARRAAKSFGAKAAPGDKLGLVQFNDSVNTLLDLSTDRKTLNARIANIKARGGTALYDAVAQGVNATNGCSRRAVIVLSDGGDIDSRTHSIESAMNVANKVGIPVFVVGLKGTTYKESVLRKIAEGTGAQLVQTSKPSALSSLYDLVDKQLKGQYYIGLKLEIPKTGKEHRLEVTSVVEGSPTTSERSFVY